MKLATKSNRAHRSIWEACARWARCWFEYLPSVPVDGYELYMRWPGERMPPWPSSRPHRDVQEEDWELAA